MHADPRRTALSVLGTAFAMNFAARGLAESFVVFVLPLSDSFGWERAAVLSIQSLAMLTTGLSAPFAGRLFDSLGPRTVYGLGFGLFGAGMSLAPFVESLWHAQICLGLAVGMAAACLGNAPNSALVGRWFERRLPLAMSILWSAAGIGILAVVPLAQLLVDRYGWNMAYQLLGGAALLAIVPSVLLPWRRYTSRAPRRPESGGSETADGWTLPRAARNSGFWGLFTVLLLTSAGMYAVIVQAVAYFVEIGFTPLEAATAWGFSGVLLPAGMIGFGWLDTRLGRRPSIFLSYALSLLGVALLWFLGRHPSVWLLGACVLCFGSTAGSRGPLVSTIAMRLFPGQQIGTIFGTITIGAGLGAAFGSWFGGLLHDWGGGYDLVLAWAFLAILCGQLPFWVIRPLRG